MIKDLSYKPKGLEGVRSVRPKDAGTLILLRQFKGQNQILMGQRHKNMEFMPNKFVFPGGRVNPSDNRIKPATDFRPEVDQTLRLHTSRNNVRALALAAIRETFEETGLLVGRKRNTGSQRKSRSPEWLPFNELGVDPSLNELDFIARAITPPGRHRRYDARFFITNADNIQGDLHETNEDTSELLALKWIDLHDALELNLPDITHVVVQLVIERCEQKEADTRPLFVRYLKDHMHATRLEC